MLLKRTVSDEKSTQKRLEYNGKQSGMLGYFRQLLVMKNPDDVRVHG